jgi:hypothetical protein
MSRNRKTPVGTMLELWRPPQGAGEPLGCLTTTYTFAPGLFDEQCLARFLDIESEPDREDLAFLLERESRLGSAYVGVLVDHMNAGVEHSLRWDVLPVRIRGAKQHAKISLLAWSRHVRIIVASANLTDPGYRTNYEVAASVDSTPGEAHPELLTDAISFLRRLLAFVPGSADNPADVQRARAFLAQVERQTREWKPSRKDDVRRRLVVTLPASVPGGADGVSTLQGAVDACRKRGASPHTVWVASPFFDSDQGFSPLVSLLCKLMGREVDRYVCFCVPAVRDGGAGGVPRLAAPRSLWTTPARYNSEVAIKTLPDWDGEKNQRPWHAKMMGLDADNYTTLMIGSSNFTSAGMGLGEHRNAEANVIVLVDNEHMSRRPRELRDIWPKVDNVDDPASAEWLGPRADPDEDAQSGGPPLPAGFISATYRAGDHREIVLRLDPEHLPEEWRVHSCGSHEQDLLSDSAWKSGGRPAVVDVSWTPVQPPDRLLVRWEEGQAFMPINVADSRQLPPPAKMENMSADDMLWILAAADPSAAFRAWAKRQHPSTLFDEEVDSATPIDLDPLRRYELEHTFLHRIRRRARVLAQLRANMERPVWSLQALEWRFRGLVGLEKLADRLLHEFGQANGSADEALLALADFLIVLREVDYKPTDGSLPEEEFRQMYHPFLASLARRVSDGIDTERTSISEGTMQFWNRVVEQCQR